jgi:hypothetical protein
LKESESKLTESISARDAQAKPQDANAELRREIEQLKEKLVVTLTKAEARVAKTELEDKITKLEAKLVECVPRDMVERLTAEIKGLEEKLAVSVPRSEVDALAEKTNRLEATLTEKLEKLNSAEARSRDLELRLRESEGEMNAFRNRIKELEAIRDRVSVMSGCPSCRQPTFPGDIYCGNCGTILRRAALTPTSPPSTAVGSGSPCPTCGYKKNLDESFRELGGTPPSRTPTQGPIVPRAVLVMPDQSEITLPQVRRVLGRNDLIKYLKPENSNRVSNAHFTITRENNVFYLQDGGPDPENFTITEENGTYYVQNDGPNPQGWRPSVYGTKVNGVLLQPGAKQKLNHNDVIEVSRLALNLTFKINKQD